MKTILTMLSLLCSLWFAPQQIAAQFAAPKQKGEFDIGFEIFDADPHEARDLSTPLWYPVAPGTEGNPLIYTHGGLPYESPFFGGVLRGVPSSAGPFPLVVLSHGSGAWGIQFAHLAESLASHGYVVEALVHRTRSQA